ncbi:MAG: glycosyl transferase, partial [Rhodospirillales bacterium]|nr:glycosyl transferase [Rhodospirillales bacterium]
KPRAAVTALAAAAVALPVLFHGVVPALDRMWVSRALAKTVSRIHPDGPVALAGFTEPSAVFLLGTATRLGDGANAARLLLEQPGALAAIERREDEAFRQGLGERPAILLETVEGFNYSRGRAVSLGLYMLPGKER